MSRRVRAESVLAVLALVAAVVTAAFPTWLESLFEASPDSGSGGLVWSVAVALLVVSIALSLFAHRDFGLSRAAGPDAGLP